MEAWVDPSVLSGCRTVLLKEQSAGMVYGLYANTDTSRPSGHVSTPGETDTRGTAQLALNTWTHLAVTYDGSTLRLYVNGTQVSSKAVTGAMPAGTQPLRIGGNAIWGEYFAGLIDEVRIYNRALSSAEIGSDMTRAVADS
jgi:Concanavalin A-like lectin/glucanases superfamily